MRDKEAREALRLLKERVEYLESASKIPAYPVPPVIAQQNAINQQLKASGMYNQQGPGGWGPVYPNCVMGPPDPLEGFGPGGDPIKNVALRDVVSLILRHFKLTLRPGKETRSGLSYLEE